MKSGLDYMGPAMFNALRFIVGAIALLIVGAIMKLGIPPKKYWKYLIIIGLLQTGAVFLFVMYGLSLVDAGKSSVLLYTMPLWSSLLAVPYLKEKLSMKQLIGLAVGMIGLLTILGWDIWFEQEWEVVIGELLIVLASLLWATANIYFRLHLQVLPKVQSSAYQMLCGSIAFFIFALITEWGEPIQVNAASIYNVLYSGLIASALCFTVWYIIMSKINMVTATIATLLVPIFGLFFTSLILDERITVSIVIGAGLIIYGIFIAQTGKRSKKQLTKTQP